MAHARDEGREGAEKRHETRDDDREPTIFLEEVVELVHAFFGERLHPAESMMRAPKKRAINSSRCYLK